MFRVTRTEENNHHVVKLYCDNEVVYQESFSSEEYAKRHTERVVDDPERYMEEGENN